MRHGVRLWMPLLNRQRHISICQIRYKAYWGCTRFEGFVACMAVGANLGAARALEMTGRGMPVEMAAPALEMVPRGMPFYFRLLSAPACARLNFVTRMDIHGSRTNNKMGNPSRAWV